FATWRAVVAWSAAAVRAFALARRRAVPRAMPLRLRRDRAMRLRAVRPAAAEQLLLHAVGVIEIAVLAEVLRAARRAAGVAIFARPCARRLLVGSLAGVLRQLDEAVGVAGLD